MDSRVFLSGMADMAGMGAAEGQPVRLVEYNILGVLMTVHFRVRDDATRILHVYHVAARLTPATGCRH